MTKPDVVRMAYSVQDAAQALSLSVVTVRRALSRGLIRSAKLGHSIRIPAAEVERLIAEGLPRMPRTDRPPRAKAR